MHNESIKVKGSVVITKTPVDGSDPEVITMDNLVVTNGKTLLRDLLGGAANGKRIEKIHLGTSATAAAVTDTAITGGNKLTATITYPAANQVTFTATMDANTGNGTTFNEIGLISLTDEKLFSRLVITAIAKSSAYQITVAWTISFN